MVTESSTTVRVTGVGVVLVSHSSSVEELRHGGRHEEAHGVRPPWGVGAGAGAVRVVSRGKGPPLAFRSGGPVPKDPV